MGAVRKGGWGVLLPQGEKGRGHKPERLRALAREAVDEGDLPSPAKPARRARVGDSNLSQLFRCIANYRQLADRHQSRNFVR